MEKAKYILIRFNEKEKLVSAFQLLQENDVRILDVLSPVPVDELEGKMNKRKSFIGLAGLIAGLLGVAAVLYFQLWVSGKAYPMFYGGKPFDAWLSFVPVLFESVVLLTSLAIVFTFLIETRLFSKRNSLPKSLSFTDDKFAIVLANESITESKQIFLNTHFEIEKVQM